MDTTLSILSSLSAAFVAGVAVAMSGRSARASNAAENAPGKRRNENENSPGRYPTPSAPPANSMKNANSGTTSAASRYTKNYGGSSRKVTFATPLPASRGRSTAP